MKKSSFIVACLLLSTITWGQISGTLNIPGNYATIKAAVTALNTQGVGTGGVTFLVAAGHTETSSNIVLSTPTGSAAKPIVFIRSGSGANPLIIAAPGISPLSVDGIVKFAGTDYVTFDGIDLIDPVTNIGEACMTWGYAVLMASEVDASQNINLVNCNITLQNDQNSWQSIGIYSSNFNADGTMTFNPTSAAGVVSNCRVDNCTISQVSGGIEWQGVNSIPYYGLNNYFGYNAGNTVTNFGTLGMILVYGIHATYQQNLKIANNMISTTGDPFNLLGISAETGFNSNVDIYLNNVNLVCTGGSTTVTGIENRMGNNGTSNSVTINSNTVSVNYATATYGALRGIFHFSGAWYCEINDNIVQNCLIGADAPFTGIYTDRSSLDAIAGSVWNINNNIVRNVTSVVGPLGGQISYGIYNNGSGQTCTISGNQIYDISWPSASVGYGMYVSNSHAATLNINNNSVHNMSKPNAVPNVLPKSGRLCGMRLNSTGLNQSHCTIEGNDVYELSNSWGGQVMPFLISGGNNNTTNVLSNRVHSITGIDAAVHGIYYDWGINFEISKNVIYNMQAAGDSGAVYGISTGTPQTASITSVCNNYISDLRAPESVLPVSAGLNLFGTAAGTSYKFYNNTVYLDQNPVSGNPLTAAMYANTAPDLDMRNNILVNKCKVLGTGLTVAFWRSNTSGTTYSANSNFNCLQADIPGASNLLFYAPDVSTPLSAVNMAQYSTIFPQETKSFSETPPFINVTTKPFNLRLNAAVGTACESGGSVISSPAITTDYDGQPRFPNAGYPNSALPLNAASAPDVGADEFGGIPALTASVTSVACPAVNDGAIDMHVNAGTAPFTYLWSNNATSEDLTGLAAGNYSVTVTDAIANKRSRSWVVLPGGSVCNNVSVSGSASTSVCFSALQTITVGNYTITAPSGHVEFVAGHNILFEPGTVVLEGAYMWGHITTTSTYCSPTDVPLVASGTGLEEPQAGLSHATFTIYPNPTSGSFTLVQKGEQTSGNVGVEVYTIQGERVLTEKLVGEQRHEFRFSEMNSGLYFVKITTGNYVETIKLIKM